MDGKQLEVRHPEMVLLGNTSMLLGVALDPNETVYERVVDIDLSQITRLDPVKV